MSRPDLSSDTSLLSTLAGLTRLLLVVLLTPGIMAAALVASVLAICLTPVLLLGWPAHWSDSWLTRLISLRPDVATHQSASS
jgi:hypothetical protein